MTPVTETREGGGVDSFRLAAGREHEPAARRPAHGAALERREDANTLERSRGSAANLAWNRVAATA